MGNLKLTSSAFEDGGEIPRECGYKNGNKVPPLTVSGIPEGTKSLSLIMDDPDAMEPAGKVWVHWVAWNIEPTTTELENLTTEGMTDFGEVGYGGPAPPDKRHTYVSNFTHMTANWIFLLSLLRLMLKKQWKVTS